MYAFFVSCIQAVFHVGKSINICVDIMQLELPKLSRYYQIFCETLLIIFLILNLLGNFFRLDKKKREITRPVRAMGRAWSSLWVDVRIIEKYTWSSCIEVLSRYVLYHKLFFILPRWEPSTYLKVSANVPLRKGWP